MSPAPKRRLPTEEILKNEPEDEDEEFKLGPPPEGAEPEDQKTDEDEPARPWSLDDLGPDERPDPIDGEPDACVESDTSETATDALLNVRPQPTTSPEQKPKNDVGSSKPKPKAPSPEPLPVTPAPLPGAQGDAPENAQETALGEPPSRSTASDTAQAAPEPQPAPQAEAPKARPAAAGPTSQPEEEGEEEMPGRPRCTTPVEDLPRPRGRHAPDAWLKKTWSEANNRWEAHYCEPNTKGAVPMPKNTTGKRRRYKKVDGQNVAVKDNGKPGRNAAPKASAPKTAPKAPAKRTPLPKRAAAKVPSEKANGVDVWKDMLEAEEHLKQIDEDIKALTESRVEAEQAVKDLKGQVKEILNRMG